MTDNDITIVDMVTQMINNNQLSAEDELRIKQILEGRLRNRSDGQKGMCLAEAINSEMAKKLALQDPRMKNMCELVYNRCFRESRIGRMDSLKLTEKTVKKFEKDVRELYGLNENEIVFFMGMLQVGLDKLADEKLLSFIPDRHLFRDFINTRHTTIYIDNPYSPEETEKIIQWMERHPTDARGLAVGLWFTGGISLTEIVNLTKKDCWGGKRTADSIMKFEERLFCARNRAGIVRNALDLHPSNVKYVFVIPRRDGSGWKRLTEQGLQKKIGCICQDLGITYKKVHKNEAIKLTDV